jgi:hypothetical protein
MAHLRLDSLGCSAREGSMRNCGGGTPESRSRSSAGGFAPRRTRHKRACQIRQVDRCQRDLGRPRAAPSCRVKSCRYLESDQPGRCRLIRRPAVTRNAKQWPLEDQRCVFRAGSYPLNETRTCGFLLGKFKGHEPSAYRQICRLPCQPATAGAFRARVGGTTGLSRSAPKIVLPISHRRSPSYRRPVLRRCGTSQPA